MNDGLFDPADYAALGLGAAPAKAISIVASENAPLPDKPLNLRSAEEDAAIERGRAILDGRVPLRVVAPEQAVPPVPEHLVEVPPLEVYAESPGVSMPMPGEDAEDRADGVPRGGSGDAARSARVIWSDLIGDPPERDWVIRDWIGYYPTLIAGRGSAGKSLMMQQLASAVALGRDFLGHVEAPRRVLYWACEEDRDELWRRQDRFARWLSVGMAEFDDSFVAEARLGMENTLYATAYGRPVWTPMIETLRQQVGDYAADVLVLDNLGQVFGADENRRHDVTAFINGLIGLGADAGRDKPLAIVLIGHPAKIAGSEYAGNGAWENAVRMRLFLGDRMPDEKQPEADEEIDPRVRVLAKRKTNYSDRDYIRFLLDEGVFVAEQADGGGVVASIKRRRAREVVLEAVGRLAAMGLNCSERRGPNYLPTLMRQYKLDEQVAQGDLAVAMRQLMTGHALRRVEIGKDNARRPKYGLVVTGSDAVLDEN